MLHTYRKTATIKAEQFDGSEKMMKKYNITDDGFGDTYTFRFDNNCLPLRKGWWIVNLGNIALFGVQFNDWNTMDDDKFRRTYEEVKDDE